MLNTIWAGDLDDDLAREVRGLLLAARASDGRPEITADGPLPFGKGLHLLGRSGAELAGYAHLDTSGDAFGRQVAELIVHPAHRRKGYGTAMARALVENADREMRVWAHGDHPAAARIAEHEGFRRVRELLVMHAPVDPGWPEPRPAEGITLRTFVPGRDEQAVVDVNARAFDWHPEQGSLTVGDLAAAERADWFDADGFFLAERADRIVGFHWTKVHPAEPGQFGGEPVGEVYVVGVDPGAQGGGLGKALTLAGLRYLAGRGLTQVILYVEGDNAPAISVYSRLGFTRYNVDVQYAQ